MSGRTAFTRSEIGELRETLRELRRADPARQKTIRGRMRRMGFHIRDFSHDADGFVASDLDELIRRGTITISEDDG